MSINKKTTIINAEEYFEKECRPIMKQLIDKCFLGGIPCFFTAAVKNDEETGTTYIADGYLTGSAGINLEEDRIKYHMMIQAGCIAKPRQEIIEMNMDDFLNSTDDDDRF